MKKKTLLPVFLVCCAFSAALFSCKDKSETLTLDYHYNYCPLDSGHYVVYNVDSILYTFNGQHHNDTVHYQWKEMITDTFYDNENRLNYRLECYRRPDSLSGWNIDRVWYVLQTTTNLQKVEDDLRFVKLVFPPADGAQWNGNIYIPSTDQYADFEDWTYNYSDVHSPYSINGFSFDSTLTVNEIDEENLIQKKLRREVYAANVGMIYQEWEIMNKQDVLSGWDDPNGPENGFKIRMTIAEHN